MKLSDLSKLAMLGTERQPLPELRAKGQLDQLLSRLDPQDRERALLNAAALLTQFERTGNLPSRDRFPGPDECPAEEQPRISLPVASLLKRLLDGEEPGLLPELLDLIAKRQQIVAPELLPQLLDLGVTKPKQRPQILAVLGRRGVWLARLNPVWSWVGGDTEDENVWHTGDKAARVTFLQHLRRTRPAEALKLLQDTWKQESPDDRASFIAELATGLSISDEPFLEAALDDKRKEARRAAALLLGQLPDSTLVRRMKERVQPLLKFTPAEAGAMLKLKRSKKAVIEVVLPAECDKSMQRDGIEPKPPKEFGEKAWWLIQMLEVVPLNTWEVLWNLPPDEIIATCDRSEWNNEFSKAWTRTATRQQNAVWAETLLTRAVEAGQTDKLSSLLQILPAQRREAVITEIFDAKGPNADQFRGELVALCAHDWSPDFSRMVLAWLRELTTRESSDWQLRSQLKEMAPLLASETLAEAPTGWKTDQPAWEFWGKGVDEFFATIQFRAACHQHLNL